MNKVLPWMLVSASVLITACASIDNDEYAFKDGWRRAKVLEIGSTNTVMQAVAKDCRLELRASSRFDRYAVASYSIGGRSRTKLVVAAPTDSGLAVGEWVYINVRDCTKPLNRVAESPKRQ